MDSNSSRTNKHADTMRIDIKPEEVGEERQKKKIVVHRRKQPHLVRSKEADEESTASDSVVGGTEFRKLLQNIYDAVLVTDIEGIVMGANDRASIFFRSDEDFLRGRHISQLISGADTSIIDTILQNLEEDRFTLIQAECIRKDGTMFPSEISANRIELSNQECISFFVRDITRRRAREEQLRTGYFAIQNSGSGIAITDLSYRANYLNPAMKKILGYVDGEDFRGIDLKSFFVGDGIEHALNELEQNFSWSGELEISPKDGRQAYVHVSIVKNINSEDVLTGYIFSFMDVSNERHAQQKLEAYAARLRHNNEEMRKDLEMARDVQRTLLPRRYPSFADDDKSRPLLDFAHIYIPCGTIGGDFFDVIKLSENKAGIFMADVSGHGMRAALITATVRGIIEEIAIDADHPRDFMSKLNSAYNAIFRITEDFGFVTAVYGVLDTKSGEMEMSIAGHPAPILLKSGHQTAELIASEKLNTPAIGLIGKTKHDFRDFRVNMSSGDILLFYTDGIFEESDEKRVEYGVDRLRQAFSRNSDKPLDDVLDAIVSDVRTVTNKREFLDDVCMLALAFDRERIRAGAEAGASSE